MKISFKTLNRPGFAQAFTKLCAEPFTPAEKFRLAQTKREFEFARSFFSEVHDGMVREYSANGSGDAVDLADPVKRGKFEVAIRELLDQEVDVKLAGKLRLPAETRLDANDLAELIELIEEPK